ncbi:acyl-CoA thioesterase [Pseudenhygromyxa sp. WMMC2535]|uniref:acyl-CoA thioesterase n=1 Tax=Pseudenhygromyxa sp. WMMC2535 TaxID=2712867 RepID=UPI0015521C05|nr:thioesterase family protein [Pseudenhygromyxa sp. WMMC2535]NVB41122.1 acyl-CoA thioesterase [Pseudenhygromyxa sp. WMMC2535]
MVDHVAPPPGFAAPDALVAPVSMRQPVAWGELDALGHVNHTIYLRWFENVRFAWFERVGVAALMHESRAEGGAGVGPILARVSCDYRAPVAFPDHIWVSAACVALGGSSMRLRSRVWSEARAELVAEGEVVIVMVDYDAGGRSLAVPETIRAAIRALDGDGLVERGQADT